jgi:predicted nucleic acid-binding protein
VIIPDQIFIFLKTSEVIIYFFIGTLLVDLCKEVNDVWIAATKLRFNIRLDTANVRPEFVCGALVCEEQGPLVI